MDRKNKIIVSVVGIFIILFALLGITYGYFLTRITGNTNANSISITTANLELVYYDGTGEILTGTNIIPGDEVASKTFTVSNNGNARISEYQVYLENVINDFEYTEDVKLSITCTYVKSDASTGSCTGYNNIYPTTNMKLISNAIDVGEVHTYVLKVNYLETGTDQSNDMGKTLQGKIQIYDPNDIVSVAGVVSNYDSNYYVEMQSVPKTSQIAEDGTYVIHGIMPGNHTLFIKYVDETGSEKTISSTSIVVSKGNEANVSVNETSGVGSATITNTTSEIVFNVAVSNNKDSISITAGDITDRNPFNNTSLAYKILDNAYKATGDKSIYSVSALSNIAEEKSKYKYSKGLDPSWFENRSIDTSKYYVYSDDYEIDSITGMFTLKNPKMIQFSEGYSILIGKYITDFSGYTLDEVESYMVDGKEFTNIFKVGSRTDNEKLFYNSVHRGVESTEKILSVVEDNYTKTSGINSYYFRGGVIDNYVEFNNMCFRIIRIEGDGSIKLVLAAEKKCSEITVEDVNTSLINEGKLITYGYKTQDNLTLLDYGYNSSSNPGLKQTLEDWFNSSGLSSKTSSLKKDTWCLGGNYNYKYNDETGLLLTNSELEGLINSGYYTWNYSSRNRISYEKKISLLCENEISVSSYIGTLTIDEVVLAGGDMSPYYASYYLYDNAQDNFWTLSMSKLDAGDMYPYENDYRDMAFIVGNDGYNEYYNYLLSEFVSSSSGVVPAITLSEKTLYTSGNGTITDPYKVN